MVGTKRLAGGLLARFLLFYLRLHTTLLVFEVTRCPPQVTRIVLSTAMGSFGDVLAKHLVPGLGDIIALAMFVSPLRAVLAAWRSKNLGVGGTRCPMLRASRDHAAAQ